MTRFLLMCKTRNCFWPSSLRLLCEAGWRWSDRHTGYPPPEKHRNIPRTKTLITSTGFQLITASLVHINLGLCMIILQSFQFVGQIVRRWYSLQNVFQMTRFVSKAHVQSAREIVSDTTAVHRKFWAALGRRRTITTEMNNGFSKMGPPLTLPITHYRGYGNDLRIDSLVGGVTLSGRHTHPIHPRRPPPPIFTFGVIWRTECTKTTPRQSVTWR